MHRGENLELNRWKGRVFCAGYLSERLWAGSEKSMADFLGSSVKNGHERVNKVKIEPKKI